MKTRHAAVFLVATVVLAGCAGSPTTGIETTTDESVETVTDEGNTDLPPGVSESGVENASKLLEANYRALAETGYAFRLVWNDAEEADYETRAVSHGTVAKEFAPYRIRTENEARFGNRTHRTETDVWGNESVALAEYEELNRTHYRTYVNEPNESVRASPFEMSSIHGLSGQLSHEAVVSVAVRTGEYEVESVERRDGLTLTTLRATEVNRSLGERDAEEISEYDATLVVDERGLIHRANLTLAFPESTFSYDFELTEVGGVVVAYPSWADRALETENATTSGPTADWSTATSEVASSTGATEPTTTTTTE